MTLQIGKKRQRVLSNNTQHLRTGAGFTIIELAIVASIILVLVAVSTPLFRDTFRELELKDSAYNIGKMIRYAEASAIMEEKRYKIVFDIEKRAYWLLKEDEKSSEGLFKKTEGRFGNKFFLPKDILLKSDKNELIFLPNGRSTRASISVIDGQKKKGYDIKTTGRSGQTEISSVIEK